MLHTSELKTYIFETAGPNFSGAEVKQLIADIEKLALKVESRTPTQPEVVVLDRVKLPVGRLVDRKKPGIAWELSSIGGRLPANFFPRMDSGRFLDICNKRLPFGVEVFFRVSCRSLKLNRKVSCLLELIKGVWWIGFSEWALLSEKHEERLRRLSYFIDKWELPVVLKKQRKKHIVNHTGQGETWWRYSQEDDVVPEGFRCTLPGLSTDQIMRKLNGILANPELRAGAGSWSIQFDTKDNLNADPQRSLDKFNGVGFPGKQAEVTFFWHLLHYGHFPRMVDMARDFRSGVGQSLLRFEFARAKQCQVDAMVNAKGRFKLLFSFDQADDAAELTKILKLKLRPYG